MSLNHLTKLRSRAELQQASAPHDGRPQTMTDEQRTATADLIIKMGRVRRGEIDLDAKSEEINPVAAAILRAGRRRRNEEE